MVKIHVVYEGDLHNQLTHEPSGQTLHTDAPKDNQGKGETFSPTDLFAASLVSCVATLIGIYAKRKGWDLRGMKLSVDKTMSTEGPRRVAKLPVEVWMPIAVPDEEKEKVERVAYTCPVHKSLHPDIEAPIVFHWKE